MSEQPAIGAVGMPNTNVHVILDEGDVGTGYTANQECDCRTALTRGVAAYIAPLSILMPGGRELRFKQVLGEWSEAEMPSKFPSAVVYAVGSGTYDADAFTPRINEQNKLAAPDGRYMMRFAEFVLEMQVAVWCTDSAERMGLVALLEQAFNPTSFMYGFRLDLPWYFNARASFELKGLEYRDSEEDAMKRRRIAVFTLEGRVPLMRVVSVPIMATGPKYVLTVVEPTVVLDVES